MYSLIILQIFLAIGYGYPNGHSGNNVLPGLNKPVIGDLSEVTNAKVAQLVNAKGSGPIFPDSGRKQAVLEQESGLSMLDSKYGQLQEFVAGFYNPKPVVDSIEEHEKYGNDGDKFRSIGTALVNGLESVSNVLNAAVEVPFVVASKVGKKITASLNQVGGKLVGLA